MKKLIAFRGTQDTGKTSSIRMAFEMIKNHFGNGDYQEKILHRRGADFAALISVKSLKIGMVSYSEYVDDLRATLPKFAELGCQLIVCATKTRNTERGALLAVIKFSKQHHYDVKYIWMETNNLTPGQRKEKNKEKVEEILRTVQELLEGEDKS